jgi:cysteine synthase A
MSVPQLHFSSPSRGSGAGAAAGGGGGGGAAASGGAASVGSSFAAASGAAATDVGLDAGRSWALWASQRLSADAQRSADTHLIPVPLPAFPSVHFYLKDESVHPSGSLKHRLARSLFLYSIVNGWLREKGTVVESSSGSTAISEAYFARLLGLKFVAVMPRGTSPQKIALIERYGGEPHFVECAADCRAEAERLTRDTRGAWFMDQFTYAERATDFRGNNNLAASLLSQMSLEPHPTPSFIVCGAGTGGTSATLGRYVRYHGVRTSVVVADPERSAFFPYFVSNDAAAAAASVAGAGAGRIEGIGRPKAELSFVRTAVDAMVSVPDAFSVGALAYLQRALGRSVGGSTGTIFCTVLTLAERMRAAGAAGSIVGILCDGGERYVDTLYSLEWRRAHGLSDEAVAAAERTIENFVSPSAEGAAVLSPWVSAKQAAAAAAVREGEDDGGGDGGEGDGSGDGDGGGSEDGAADGGGGGGGVGGGGGGGADRADQRVPAPSRLGTPAWPLVVTLRAEEVAAANKAARAAMRAAALAELCPACV